MSETESDNPAPTIGSGDAEHFWHAWRAFRSDITDNDNIAGFDAAGLNGFECSIFSVEHASGSDKVGAIVSGEFYNAAFRRERAAQDADAAGCFLWLCNGSDYFLPRSFYAPQRLLQKSASGDRGGIHNETGFL